MVLKSHENKKNRDPKKNNKTNPENKKLNWEKQKQS